MHLTMLMSATKHEYLYFELKTYLCKEKLYIPESLSVLAYEYYMTFKSMLPNGYTSPMRLSKAGATCTLTHHIYAHVKRFAE